MRTRLVTITPKMASEWLKKNTRNRPVSQARVQRYADDIKADRWAETGEAIKFTVDGILIDGQHRLFACVLAQSPFKSLVVDGIEPIAFNKLDQGNVRTLGDCFGRERKKHYTRLAAAVRILWNLEHGGSAYYGPRQSIDDGFSVLERWPRIETNVEHVMKTRVSSCQLHGSVVAGYATFLEVRHGRKTWEFFDPFNSCVDMKAKSPAHVLHNALYEAFKGGRDLSRVARHAYVVRAYNAHILGKRLPMLRYRDKDDALEFVR